MGWIKNILRRPNKYPRDGARTASNLSLPKANSNVLVRVPEEWPYSDASIRQSVDDAYKHAAALEAEASDGSASSLPRAGVYGPDGYELVGQLGTRRTSCLKLMRNRRSKELVVARCLSRTDNMTPEALQRVADESLTQRRLVHPNIIAFREFFVSPTAFVSIMEYAPGGRMQERLVTNGRLSEAQAQPLFLQLLNALTFSHDLGVFHKNLSMDELLLSGSFIEPRLKVAGLGYSTPGRPSDVLHGIPDPHKAPYMAPELLGSEESSLDLLDGRALDAWACGVILFKWVTGELPFKTDEPDSRAGKVIASQVVSCQFSYPETAVLSSRVKDLLSHILVKDPEQRYTLAQMAAHNWLDRVPPAPADRALPSAQSEKDILQLLAAAFPAEAQAGALTPPHAARDIARVSATERDAHVSGVSHVDSNGVLMPPHKLRGDEPPPPLTPDPGTEWNSRPRRSSLQRRHPTAPNGAAPNGSPLAPGLASDDAPRGGDKDGRVPPQQVTPARFPSQRAGARPLTPDTPAPATPQAPAKVLRQALKSPFADLRDDERAVDDSASEPPSSPGVSSPSGTRVSSPSGTGVSSPADAYNPLLPSSSKVFGSVSWSRASRKREVTGRSSLDDGVGHAGHSGTPGDVDRRAAVSQSPTVPKVLAATQSGASPHDGETQGLEGLTSSIRSRLTARLGERPSSAHRKAEDSDPVFLDEDVDRSSSLSAQVSFPGHEGGLRRAARTDEATEVGSPVLAAPGGLHPGSPHTPEHGRLRTVSEESNSDWKIRAGLASPSGSGQISESGGSPQARFFGDATGSPRQRPKFKIASAADGEGQGKAPGGDAEAQRQAEGDVPRTLSKARQMAEAVTRAVAEATAPGASLSPAHSGPQQPRQRVGNLKDSPQWATLQALLNSGEELPVRRITDPPVLQTPKTSARPKDLHHHKYVPPSVAKTKWEAPKLSLSGPPSATASTPSPFIQGPRTKPWVPTAPSVVQILEDAPGEEAPARPEPLYPHRRRLTIVLSPDEAPERDPAASSRVFIPPAVPVGSRARALNQRAEELQGAASPRERRQGRSASRRVAAVPDDAGPSGSPRSLSLERGSRRSLDREWGSGPVATRPRTPSLDSSPWKEASHVGMDAARGPVPSIEPSSPSRTPPPTPREATATAEGPTIPPALAVPTVNELPSGSGEEDRAGGPTPRVRDPFPESESAAAGEGLEAGGAHQPPAFEPLTAHAPSETAAEPTAATDGDVAKAEPATAIAEDESPREAPAEPMAEPVEKPVAEPMAKVVAEPVVVDAPVVKSAVARPGRPRPGEKTPRAAPASHPLVDEAEPRGRADASEVRSPDARGRGRWREALQRLTGRAGFAKGGEGPLSPTRLFRALGRGRAKASPHEAKVASPSLRLKVPASPDTAARNSAKERNGAAHAVNGREEEANGTGGYGAGAWGSGGLERRSAGSMAGWRESGEFEDDAGDVSGFGPRRRGVSESDEVLMAAYERAASSVRRDRRGTASDLLTTSDSIMVSLHRAATAANHFSRRSAQDARLPSSSVVPLERWYGSMKANGKPVWAQPLRDLVPTPSSLASTPSMQYEASPSLKRQVNASPSYRWREPSPSFNRRKSTRTEMPAMVGSPAPVWTHDAFWELEPEAVQSLILEYWDLWAGLDAIKGDPLEAPPESLVQRAMHDSDDGEDQKLWEAHSGWASQIEPGASLGPDCLATS